MKGSPDVYGLSLVLGAYAIYRIVLNNASRSEAVSNIAVCSIS